MSMERIGSIEGNGILRIDAARLVDTRVLIQGSSGSGKSWLVRLLVEKFAAKIPVLILDLEGEFVTLREKFDFVVAGEGGEVGVDVRSAALLARKLLELKLSGVVSLYELDRPKRRAYVRAFLESIMAAPRELWAPRLIVLDEAHEFAPEAGKSESAGAVIDIASRGRKRGYCLIAATQRMSKLDKDVVAECRNIFVGQTTLDVDVKRALDTLGFAAGIDEKRALRGLDHQFYAMGPATSADGVVLFKADEVKTTHPESGLRRSLSPPEPSKRIKQALGELADLPKQAEEETKTLADAQRKIAELHRQLNAKPAVAPDDRTVERAVAAAVADRDRFWKGEASKLERSHSAIVKRVCTIRGAAEKLLQLTTLNGEATVEVATPPAVDGPKLHHAAKVVQKASPTLTIPANTAGRIAGDLVSVVQGDFKINKTQQRILDALAWYESIGQQSPSNTKIGAVALIDPTGGYFSNTVGPLSTAGLIDRGVGFLTLTDAGRAKAQPIKAAASLAEYHETLKTRVLKMKSATKKTTEVLDAIISAGGKSITTAEIGEIIGVDHTGGYFSNLIGPISTAGLITRSGGTVTPTDVLFPEGLY